MNRDALTALADQTGDDADDKDERNPPVENCTSATADHPIEDDGQSDGTAALVTLAGLMHLIDQNTVDDAQAQRFTVVNSDLHSAHG